MLLMLDGDSSSRGLNIFSKEFDINFSAISATIENNINQIQYSLGADTPLNIVKASIDSMHDTTSSFQRAFIVETM